MNFLVFRIQKEIWAVVTERKIYVRIVVGSIANGSTWSLSLEISSILDLFLTWDNNHL